MSSGRACDMPFNVTVALTTCPDIPTTIVEGAGEAAPDELIVIVVELLKVKVWAEMSIAINTKTRKAADRHLAEKGIRDLA